MKTIKPGNFHAIFLFVMLFASIACNAVRVRFPILNDVKLIELHLCEQEITQETNETEKQQYCGNTFSSDKEELFLCGEVSGINDIDADLGIFLRKDGVEKLVFHNTIDDRFTNGLFCRAIPLPDKDNRGGTYTIELRDARTILDSIEFEIK